MKILVINCGSSSLKYQLMDMTINEPIVFGLCERIGTSNSVITHNILNRDKIVINKPLNCHMDAMKIFLDLICDENIGVITTLDKVDAVGHRIGHGGKYKTSTIIDEGVISHIDSFTKLLPIHNPAMISGIRACQQLMPNIKQVAVFDTSFHSEIEDFVYLYPIPFEYYEKYGIRKYGFHGTSHQYVSNQASLFLNKNLDGLKIISCHLGSGSSIAAIKNGKSIDTTMGFSPLDGIIMGTRCGSIDAGMITYLINQENIDPKTIEYQMNFESGLLGISGVSNDLRDIYKFAEEGHERCQIAIKMLIYQVKKFIGSYIAAMGGVDILIFTAGIGENSTKLREDITENMNCFGIEIDKNINYDIEKKNVVNISSKNATVQTLVIKTNEEQMIALDTQKIITSII